VQQDAGDEEEKDVVIQLEDHGGALRRDLGDEVHQAEHADDDAQQRAVFEPLAGFSGASFGMTTAA
jgi:hypothetical protein